MLRDTKKLQAMVIILFFMLATIAIANTILAQGQLGHNNYSVPPDTSNYDAPTIAVSTPTSQSYDAHNIELNFTVTKPVSWNNAKVYTNITKFEGLITGIVYIVDGKASSVSVSDNWTSKTPLTFALNLTSLPNGLHTLSVNASGWCLFAPVVFGDRYATYVEGASDNVIFTINSPPKINVLLPKNEFYNGTIVPLNFTVNEQVSWIAYSLDSQTNITVYGNTTLGNLADGPHKLQVYAQVPTGNIGASDLANFTVDIAPKVVLLSPSNNLSYNTTLLPINFTVNKQVTWMSYSLDGQSNTTISGNTTLLVSSYGNHTLTIYAKDPVGNQGNSETASFSKIPEIAPSPSAIVPLQNRESTWIIIAVASAIALSAGFAIAKIKWRNLKKRNIRVTQL